MSKNSWVLIDDSINASTHSLNGNFFPNTIDWKRHTAPGREKKLFEKGLSPLDATYPMSHALTP